MVNKIEKVLRTATENKFNDDWYAKTAEEIHILYIKPYVGFDYKKLLSEIVTCSDIQKYLLEEYNYTATPKMATQQFQVYLLNEKISYERKNTGGVRFFNLHL